MQYRQRQSRRGFTLIEVMVATAVTLLMMVSLAKIFKIIGDSMQEGRAALELNNRLRNVALRIQNDLANATATMRPPLDPGQGLGYFKYYDGPLTDYSAALYSAGLNSDADPTNDIQDLSRYGDTDDILLFTARADNVWYTGKVPLCVLQGAAPDALNTSEYVTIASQYAEIAVFAEPVVSAVGNVNLSPGPLIADPNNYAFVPGTDLPAQYRLHYRTLLIRPDLNLPAGALAGGLVGTDEWLLASPAEVSVGGNLVQLPVPTCDMTGAHQQCDLSIRRTLPPPLPANTPSPIAANSLADLTDPANRFAHVRIPLANGLLSMPVLALSPKINMPYTLADAGSTTISSPPLPREFQSGFLHPAFTLIGSRAGEDILASDVLAFDIRGFDPGAPVLASPGPDGAPGLAGIDDDGDGVTDNATELGFDGTDDAILGPGDPGYGPALAAGAPTISTGEFVDLAWGWKTRIHAPSGTPIPPAANTWGPLSGLAGPTFNAVQPFTSGLYKSGQALHTGNPSATNPPRIFQPSYDTWNARYEHDGILQAEGLSNHRGVVESQVAANVVDTGSDGLDNNTNALIDEPAEQETSPPFTADLSGIKITIRMEDPATRIVRQMSVGKEFITGQ